MISVDTTTYQPDSRATYRMSPGFITLPVGRASAT